MINREIFYKIYWKVESIITPKLKYSQYIYEQILFENCQLDYEWLDLGCGHQLLPSWRHEEEKNLVKKIKTVIGLDYDFNSLIKHRTINNRIRGDILNLPFFDNSFDLITSNMVFEHIKYPEVQLQEIFRILKPGGKLIFHTPNILGYTTYIARLIPELIKDKLVFLLQGRIEEDVFPAYYKINSKSKIEKIAKLSGFNIKNITMICSSAQFIIIPPIVILELFFIKLLITKPLKNLRTNIIAILEKTKT